MTLGFSTKINGHPTHFVEKIWVGLIDQKLALPGWSTFDDMFPKYDFDKGLFSSGINPKLHTIRHDSKNLWKVNNDIHMVINNRTKDRFQFAPTMECRSVQEIEVIRTSDYLNETIIKIDGRPLRTESEVQQLAWNDGFANMVEFWMWFRGGFKGKIIHWTDLKY